MKKSIKVALVLVALTAAPAAFGWGYYSDGYYGNSGYGYGYGSGYGCSTCNTCDTCGNGGFFGWY